MAEARPPARPEVAGAQRVVLKVGTRVLTGDDGRLALSRLFALVETAGRLLRQGREVLVVSSGAVGLGRDALGFDEAPVELADRQACAAVGQCRLMGLYEAGFSRLGLICAQVLLTQGDFDDRVRYLALRDTLQTLLRRKVVPIINENDTVSTEELAFVGDGGDRPIFGDNDRLSALVATKLGADLLVLVTDVEGVFDRDPGKHPEARVIPRIDDLDAIRAGLGGTTSGAGRGGMRSKAESASIAARAGCQAVIVSGRVASNLDRALAGDEVGTWFPARLEGLPARHRWIAWATAPRGVLHLDEGAVRALVERGASLLAKGVKRIEGDFKRGEVVELRDPAGRPIGRGMVYCDATSARAWAEGRAPEGVRNHHALIHRDHLVLESR